MNLSFISIEGVAIQLLLLIDLVTVTRSALRPLDQSNNQSSICKVISRLLLFILVQENSFFVLGVISSRTRRLIRRLN